MYIIFGLLGTEWRFRHLDSHIFCGQAVGRRMFWESQILRRLPCDLLRNQYLPHDTLRIPAASDRARAIYSPRSTMLQSKILHNPYHVKGLKCKHRRGSETPSNLAFKCAELATGYPYIAE